MKKNYIAPVFNKRAFSCPNCGVYSKQIWCNYYYMDVHYASNTQDTEIKRCECLHCEKASIWYKRNMIIPSVGGVDLPSQDLPEEIKSLYIEARDILNKSPRGAAALLRLALELLCKHLGEKGKNIDDDISVLVKKGLPIKIQQALDIVRVVGNKAVHPGQIDISDNYELASKLFGLINIIADVMITQPKEIENLYNNTLPPDTITAIEKRDKK